MVYFTDEELKEWFAKPNCCTLSKSDDFGTENLVKIPYNEDFDLLFYSHSRNTKSIGLNEKLERAGLYCRKDNYIYNYSYHLSFCCNESKMIVEHSHKEDFAKQFTELVKAKTEEIIDNKRSNISVKEVTDKLLLSKTKNYSEHQAKPDAEKEFIKGNTASDIVYKCPFSTDSMNDTEYVRFILDRESLVEETAKAYIEGHQEDILAQFYNNTHLTKELQQIYDNPEHILHRVKAIIDAVTQSDAKTVNVTINKEDKDFTFKYEAAALKFALSSYNSYSMRAADRYEFERMFDESAYFYPNEITQITYGRNVIYDASEFDMAETEDADMAQTM